MMNFNIILLAVVFCVIAGCAPSPTRYQSLALNEGYHDFQVAPDEYIVEFRGNVVTDPGTVKDYMFYRCAELTKTKNCEYFLVVGIADAPFGMVPVPGKSESRPLPGHVAQIRCCRSRPQGAEKVYRVEDVMAQVGPNLIRK